MKSILLACSLLLCLAGCSAPEPTIHAVAAGVWVSENPLGAGLGANQGWVEFEQFVLVVDSNILDHELDFLDALRETTDKPLRFLVNTHFHGDHAHGNGRLSTMGAEVIAAAAARHSYATAERDFALAQEQEHPAYEEIEFVGPSIWYEQELVLDDGTQRVELFHHGPAHTPGDTLVWLPQQGILFSGDVVTNQHLSYLGDGDLEGWIKLLDRLETLPIRVVVPGHGPLGDLETIRKQRSFLTDLTEAVEAQVAAGLHDAEEIAAAVRLPNHPLWREQQRWYRRLGVERLLPTNAD